MESYFYLIFSNNLFQCSRASNCYSSLSCSSPLVASCGINPASPEEGMQCLCAERVRCQINLHSYKMWCVILRIPQFELYSSRAKKNNKAVNVIKLGR